MNATRPTFIAMFIAAYWDLNRVLRTLWRPALVAFLVLVVCYIAGLFVPRLLAQTPFVRMIFRQAIDLASLVLIAPFLIAVHRFVLLGETTDRYAIALSNRRLQLFAGWLVALGLVASVPTFLAFATTSAAPIYYTDRAPSPNLMRAVALLIAMVAVFVLLARMAILFPAIAVDAPGAVWQSALKDTRGHGWYVVLVSFFPVLPLLLVSAVLFRLLPSLVPWFLMAGVRMAMYLAALVLSAVVASRLYQVFGKSLRQPPPQHSQ